MSVAFAMFLFSLSMSISPGPVNMTSLSSGVNYGFQKTFPFVSGATIGFTILLVAVGLGLANMISHISAFQVVLEYVGAGYIGYMGYQIMSSNTEIEVQDKNLPRFHHGFLMQWLNPKAWIACLSGVVAFNLQDSYTMLLVFVSIYFPICYLSLVAWALLGSKLQFLNEIKNGIRTFNVLTGGLLILVAVYLLYTTHT
ncbi:Cysteine/O-acetylserine efflux protein [Sporomusa rhizae]|uniref:LysE family translocator n=1 Tax=Sporomusa rhizae TaxID=357999 RepID=UPI00352AD304